MNLSDKLNSHKRGSNFKYAVITNEPSSDRKFWLDKLRNFRPNTFENVHTLSQIPAIRLEGDTMEFDLTKALSRQELDAMHDYILIDSILVHFIPLDSFVNDSNVVTFQVNDFRRVTQTTCRKCTASSNMGYNILFCLDFCIEKADIKKLSLSATCTGRDHIEGVSWGAAKVIMVVRDMVFPIRAPLMDTMGVMLFADTDLDTYSCDPRDLDLVLTPGAMERLREAALRGEIQNMTQPESDKMGMESTKTIVAPPEETGDVDSLINGMKKRKMEKEREIAEKMTKRMKSALKKPKQDSPPHTPIRSSDEEDRGRFDDLNSDIGVEESVSDQEETVPRAQGIRFVG